MQILLEVYTSLIDNSTSFKYKANLLGKATDDDGDDKSLKKKSKNSCSTETFI